MTRLMKVKMIMTMVDMILILGQKGTLVMVMKVTTVQMKSQSLVMMVCQSRPQSANQKKDRRNLNNQTLI